MAKDEKRSARTRYNRLRKNTGPFLHQLKLAAERVTSQSGPVHGKADLEALLTALNAFEKATGIKIAEPEEDSEVMDNIARFFNLPLMSELADNEKKDEDSSD